MPLKQILQRMINSDDNDDQDKPETDAGAIGTIATSVANSCKISVDAALQSPESVPLPSGHDGDVKEVVVDASATSQEIRDDVVRSEPAIQATISEYSPAHDDSTTLLETEPPSAEFRGLSKSDLVLWLEAQTRSKPEQAPAPMELSIPMPALRFLVTFVAQASQDPASAPLPSGQDDDLIEEVEAPAQLVVESAVPSSEPRA